MRDHVLCYGLLLVVMCWGRMNGSGKGPRRPVTSGRPQGKPAKPSTKRSKAPQPLAGLTQKPGCQAGEPAAAPRPQAPSAPPPRLVATRGRHREVNTSTHFCPTPACAYKGWVGRGNIRAHGHPGGSPWRQLQGVAGHGYFQETQGTPLHGKRVPPELLVGAVGALAEGLGLRAVARV